MIFSGLSNNEFLNNLRNLKINGVNIVFIKISNKKFMVNGLYAITLDGYKKENNHNNKTLQTVAHNPNKAGKIIPLVLRVLLNKPPI